MLIIEKDKTAIINMAHVTTIYIGADECSVKATIVGNTGCRLARYNSGQEAQAAMKLLSSHIGKDEVYIMPSDEEVEAEIHRFPESRERSRQGKKVKGHGGS